MFGSSPPRCSPLGLIGESDQRFLLENDLSDAVGLEILVSLPPQQEGRLLHIIFGDGAQTRNLVWENTGKLFLFRQNLNTKTNDHLFGERVILLIFTFEKKGLRLKLQHPEIKTKPGSELFFEGIHFNLGSLIFSPTKDLVVSHMVFRNTKGREIFREDFKNPVFHFVDLTKNGKNGEGRGEDRGRGRIF